MAKHSQYVMGWHVHIINHVIKEIVKVLNDLLIIIDVDIYEIKDYSYKKANELSTQIKPTTKGKKKEVFEDNGWLFKH